MNVFNTFQGSVQNAHNIPGTNFFVTTSEIDAVSKFDFSAVEDAPPETSVDLNTGILKGAGQDGHDILASVLKPINQYLLCLTNQIGNPLFDGRLIKYDMSVGTAVAGNIEISPGEQHSVMDLFDDTFLISGRTGDQIIHVFNHLTDSVLKSFSLITGGDEPRIIKK